MLWVFIAIFIMGLFAWSMQILLRQKKAWQIVSNSLNLGYVKGKLTSSPSLSGSLKSFPLTIYSEEQLVNQNGSKRYRTIIQFQLPIIIPSQGIIASSDAKNFANSLTLSEVMSVEGTTIHPSITLRANQISLLQTYLTDEKIKSLNTIMTIKGIACIFIFDENSTFVRFETPDAFDDAPRLERFLLKAVEHIRVLAS
jgi:hypothetical protein